MLTYLFCLVCIIITFLNQRKLVKVMKARDSAREALTILLLAVADLPEEINRQPQIQSALRNANKIWRLNLMEKPNDNS